MTSWVCFINFKRDRKELLSQDRRVKRVGEGQREMLIWQTEIRKRLHFKEMTFWIYIYISQEKKRSLSLLAFVRELNLLGCIYLFSLCPIYPVWKSCLTNHRVCAFFEWAFSGTFRKLFRISLSISSVHGVPRDLRNFQRSSVMDGNAASSYWILITSVATSAVMRWCITVTSLRRSCRMMAAPNSLSAAVSAASMPKKRRNITTSLRADCSKD